MTKPMTDASIARLKADFVVHSTVGAEDPDSVLRGVADTVRGIAGGKVKTATMEALPHLEIIANSGVGIDSNDVATARDRGIIITNTPDVLNDSVAELTVGLMLALARKLPQSDRFVRDGSWRDGPFTLGSELKGKRVGMLGLGRIGSEIANRLAALRMEVCYHARNEAEGQPYIYYAKLEEMAAACDWLVAIAPANAQTKGIVSRSVLEALGPEGRFINVARGSLADQVALVEMLQAGRLKGAALDVFDDEPNVPDELCALDNVVLSPHQGSRTEEARHAMDAMVVENLMAHFAGQAPPNRVV